MKRNGSLLALGIVALVVGVLVLLDQRRPSTEESARQRQHLVPGFDRARASELVFERPKITLRHEASGWWIAEPRRRADDNAVESLLAVLEYGEIERTIKKVDATLRQKLGLDAPRVVFSVEGHTLRIGADDPSRGVYVERDGEVVVAERRLIETAGIDPRLWLSMRVTLADPASARQIATDAWTLENSGGWHVAKPDKALASAPKVDALVQSLDRTRATAVDDTRAPIAGGSSLALDGHPQARFADDKVDRADGARLTVRKTDLNLLAAPVETYYERRLFPLRLDDIVEVDVGPLQLRRADGAWRIIAPTARPADDAKVRAFVEPLLAAEAARFSTTPLAGSSTRVRLATRDVAILAAVDGAHARRSGDTITLELITPLALATSF